ncbi:MAG: hypothetical protein NTY76_05320 [Candidatus Omnitrophica bacterium]|nr:hypothetical protein [Candidatus Omnitrophota bacterium]
MFVKRTKIISAFLVVAFFVQDLSWAYPDHFAYDRPSNNKLAPAPFSERVSPEDITKSLILVIEQNHHVSIKSLVLDGVEAILNEYQEFLKQNSISFLKKPREIRININPNIILRYTDHAMPLDGISGFKVGSQEKTGALVRQILIRIEKRPTLRSRQLQLDFGSPAKETVAEGEKTAETPVAPATQGEIKNKPRVSIMLFQDIARLDSKITNAVISSMNMLEDRMHRSRVVMGAIDVLRDDIIGYGHVRADAFERFSKKVSGVLDRWIMSDKGKETIRGRLAKISLKINERDDLLKGIDISYYGLARELKGEKGAQQIIFLLLSIEAGLREVAEAMDEHSRLKSRFNVIAADLKAIRKWMSIRGERPGKDLTSCEKALKAMAKHAPLQLHDQILNLTDKIAVLKPFVESVWEVKPPAGSVPGVFKYLCSPDIQSFERPPRADEVADNLGRSYDTIRRDLWDLYYHLHLLDKVDVRESGRDARYYVPERVKNKYDDIYPILNQFIGKKLRPTIKDLESAYRAIINLIGVRDPTTGKFNLVSISKRTDYKGRFNINIFGDGKIQFNIGTGYSLKNIELIPLTDNWREGFEVYHQSNLIGTCDPSTGEFSPIQEVRKPGEDRRFNLDRVRYILLDAGYASGGANREIRIIAFDGFDWTSGFKVYHLDREIASYDKKRNVMIGMSVAGRLRPPGARARVLLQMQIPNKDTNKNGRAFTAEISNFIIKHRSILGTREKDIETILDEVGLNIMEHGNGGEIMVETEKSADGRLRLKIIGKDKGSGLPASPDELVKTSLASRKRFEREPDADDKDIMVRGRGFSRIALGPDSVTIEYQGKRFVRFTDNKDAGSWFREENVAGSSAKGTNFELKFELGRELTSWGPEAETLADIHDLFNIKIPSRTNDNTKILLSENLFIKNSNETELIQVRIALASLLNSGNIAIMKPDEMRRAAMNRHVSKDKLATVFTEEDFNNKGIWNGCDKEASLRSSVLILGDRLMGNNYLYLEGVIGLARAMMVNNKYAVRKYYDLISGTVIDNEMMKLLNEDDQNNLSFAIRAVLRFKPITRTDPEDLNELKIRMEKFLIAA